MVFSYTTTGATNRSSIVRGDVAFVSGTFDFGTFTSTQTIVTGGAAVLAYGFQCSTVTAQPAAVVSSGNIAIQDIGSCTKAGDWWAIVRL